MNPFSWRRVREAVLSPSKEGETGDSSLHRCPGTAGTARGQVGQVNISPPMDLSPAPGIGGLKNTPFEASKKNDLSPSSGDSSKAKNKPREIRSLTLSMLLCRLVNWLLKVCRRRMIMSTRKSYNLHIINMMRSSLKNGILLWRYGLVLSQIGPKIGQKVMLKSQNGPKNRAIIPLNLFACPQLCDFAVPKKGGKIR